MFCRFLFVCLFVFNLEAELYMYRTIYGKSSSRTFFNLS